MFTVYRLGIGMIFDLFHYDLCFQQKRQSIYCVLGRISGLCNIRMVDKYVVICQ